MGNLQWKVGETKEEIGKEIDSKRGLNGRE
jgi:hypothetical protein